MPLAAMNAHVLTDVVLCRWHEEQLVYEVIGVFEATDPNSARRWLRLHEILACVAVAEVEERIIEFEQGQIAAREAALAVLKPKTPQLDAQYEEGSDDDGRCHGRCGG